MLLHTFRPRPLLGSALSLQHQAPPRMQRLSCSEVPSTTVSIAPLRLLPNMLQIRIAAKILKPTLSCKNVLHGQRMLLASALERAGLDKAHRVLNYVDSTGSKPTLPAHQDPPASREESPEYLLHPSNFNGQYFTLAPCKPFFAQTALIPW